MATRRVQIHFLGPPGDPPEPRPTEECFFPAPDAQKCPFWLKIEGLPWLRESHQENQEPKPLYFLKTKSTKKDTYVDAALDASLPRLHRQRAPAPQAALWRLAVAPRAEAHAAPRLKSRRVEERSPASSFRTWACALFEGTHFRYGTTFLL